MFGELLGTGQGCSLASDKSGLLSFILRSLPLGRKILWKELCFGLCSYAAAVTWCRLCGYIVESSAYSRCGGRPGNGDGHPVQVFPSLSCHVVSGTAALSWAPLRLLPTANVRLSFRKQEGDVIVST